MAWGSQPAGHPGKVWKSPSRDPGGFEKHLDVGVVRSSEPIRFASDDAVFFFNVFRILLKKQVRPWLPDLIPIVTALRGRPHCLRLQAVHRCSCLWSNKVCRLSTASLSFPVQDKDVMYILYIDLHGSTCSSFSRQDCLFAAFWSAWLVRRLLIVNRWPRHATTRSTCRNYLLPISTFHTFPRLADTSSATQETERLSIKEFWKNFEDLINWDEFWKVFLPPANP